MPHVVQPFVIGIAGGTASGKSTVCNRITQSLGGERVVLLSLDEFYRDLTPQECENPADVNFDEPEAFDIACLAACLDELKVGKPTDVPVYDFVTSRRCLKSRRHVNPADVIIVEGILALHCEEILKRCNMKVFVDTDDDVRLARRISRDTVERGRDVEGVIAQYTRFVKPSFDRYVLPSKRNADIVVPWRTDNAVAVDLITQHIRRKLLQNNLGRVYPGLHVMPGSVQTRVMLTCIRSRETTCEDFVFYADRLIRLVVEEALAQIPFREGMVTTPCGDQYAGVHFCTSLCGVSMIRSGEAMENALRACCQGIKIGKVLIDGMAGKGLDISWSKLPDDIAQRSVLLMDPVLTSGSRVLLAIDMLVNDWHVKEEDIFLITLLTTRAGIQGVCERFPKMKVITAEIDESVSEEEGNAKSSIGEFGDRYFGTADLSDFNVIQISNTGSTTDASARSDTLSDS